MRRLVLWSASALVLGACSLAGDVTPPAGLATAQAQGLGLPPTAAPLEAPRRAPDLEAGAAIFAEKCAPCHGTLGDGQGPQASALPNPPAALREAEFAQRAIPQEWYRIVTEGRLESFMPGFASLDDDQRWDVVGYALSLGLPTSQVEGGRALYQQSCVECHGAHGQGSGSAPDLASADFLTGRSLLAMYGAITEGVGQAMPGYGETLTDDERWALAAYVRSLALAPAPTPATPTAVNGEMRETAAVMAQTTAATPLVTESLAASTKGTIAGRVVNGSAGAPPPTGLDLTLHGFDGDQESLTQSQQVGPGGRFTFDGLEPTAGRVYVVTTDYQEVLYASEIGAMAADTGTLDLPLTVYETTAETGALEVSRLHLLFDFPAEDVVQVVELWLLSNLGDRTIFAGETGAVDVTLPEGASGLSLDGGTVGDRFELTEQGFRDRREIVPGENTSELIFSYNLPYDGSLDFTRTPSYPVAATVAMVSGDGPEIRGGGFSDMGSRHVSGASLRTYQRGPAEAGDDIALTLRGRPATGTANPVGTASVALGVAALVLALLGAGLIWFRPKRAGAIAERPSEPGAADFEERRTLWAIASLDNEFAQGRLDADTYHARRDDLVRRAGRAQAGQRD